MPRLKDGGRAGRVRVAAHASGWNLAPVASLVQENGCRSANALFTLLSKLSSLTSSCPIVCA